MLCWIFSVRHTQRSPAAVWLRSEKTTRSTFTADSFPLTWHWGLGHTDCSLLHPAWSSEEIFFMRNWNPVERISYKESGNVSVTWQWGAGRTSSVLICWGCARLGSKTTEWQSHSGDNHHCTKRGKKNWQGPERLTSPTNEINEKNHSLEIPEWMTQYQGLCLKSQKSALFQGV